MMRPYKSIPEDKIGKRMLHPTPAPPQQRKEGIKKVVTQRELESIIRKGMKDNSKWEKLDGIETVVTDAYVWKIERTAQAIIDRLEIDEDKLKDFIFDYAYKHPTQMAYCINDSEFAKRIAKLKPIKLKGG